MANDTLCKTDDKAKTIIAELQAAHSDFGQGFICKAIKSYCVDCAEKEQIFF